MVDFSYLDIRLLFPNLTEANVHFIESFSTILDLISIILIVSGEWMLFKKFGEKSWKSLVPIYNTYILYKYVWSKKVFWIYLASSTMFNAAQIVTNSLMDKNPDNMWIALIVLIGMLFGIVTAVCSILYAFRLAEAFGKGKIFSIGILLVYSVFVAMLGFGKIRYVGNGDADKKASQTQVFEDQGETV